MSTQQQIETQARTNPVRFLRKRGWQQAGQWWKKPGEPGFSNVGQAVRMELDATGGGAAIDEEQGAALPFNQRIVAALEKAGIASLTDLESWTDEQLTDLSGISAKSIVAIRKAVPAPGGEAA